MLTLYYGAYAHLPGENTVVIGRRSEFSAEEIPYQEIVTWTITGRVEGDDPAAVRLELLRLEAAYRKHNQPARLVHSDGTVCHSLTGAGSLTGVKVVSLPSFPRADGAEYTTYRNYTIQLECKFLIGNPNTAVRSWTETLTFRGGRPRRGVIETADGDPIEYVSAKRTAYRCTQSGQAVGFLQYPAGAAVPLFPLDLLEESETVSFGSAKLDGNRLVDWPVSWNFNFVSAAPLRALPRTILTAG